MLVTPVQGTKKTACRGRGGFAVRTLSAVASESYCTGVGQRRRFFDLAWDSFKSLFAQSFRRSVMRQWRVLCAQIKGYIPAQGGAHAYWLMGTVPLNGWCHAAKLSDRGSALQVAEAVLF